MKLVFWHWFWLFFMLLLWSSQGLSSDGLALLALSKGLILPSSLRSNWSASDATPCAWNGVGCNGRNRVASLDLPSSEVSGFIGPEIGHLKYLQILILSDNNISGLIPPELGNCSMLELLDLSQNMLSGVLPRSIGSCTKLEELYLHDNQLSGSLPETLSEIKGLKILDATSNSFAGEISFSFENCKLEIFILSYNNIKGEIPSWLGNCKSLQKLAFVSNSLSGTIPTSLGLLSNLTYLLLAENSLSGPIPPQLGNLEGLENIDFSFNNLTGGLATLRSLSFLQALNVSYNQFSGQVPDNLLKFLSSTPNSFNGNPGLCVSCSTSDSSCMGANVLKNCGGSKKRGVLGRFKIVLIVLGSLFVGAVLVLILRCILLKSRDRNNSQEAVSNMFERSSFKLNEVIEATENFDDKYIIGRGAHGTVYKATMRSGDVYAIKKLLISAHKGSYKSMVRELKTLGKIKHRNLIKLKEFWFRSDDGFILYDFMEKGSLHYVLHVIQPAPALDWCVRYMIALGTAHGLAYLHDDCRPAIIHRDIKPSNILLDKDMVPHISDFGIAKLMDQPSTASQTTGIVGTIGYMAPELAFSTKSSMESDMYSYGVVLLELLTRRTAVDPSFPDSTDIVGWVSSAPNGTDKIEAVYDPALMEEVLGTVEMEEVRKVLSVALRCVAREARQRPSMTAVVKELTDARPAAASGGGRSLSKSNQGRPGSQSYSSAY